ncbi:MAG TPA: hypothetical protein VLW50_21560 [Streptosporangiaceae bacterium]|nr:hypothetical protein [Streptosporangiaceae bacterium]
MLTIWVTNCATLLTQHHPNGEQLPTPPARRVARSTRGFGSELLQSPAIHPVDQRHPDFRNPAGVARKTQNIATVHPAHHGAPSNGNRLDKEVLDDFLANPAGMHAMAARIREVLTGGEAHGSALPDLDMDDIAATEGGLVSTGGSN